MPAAARMTDPTGHGPPLAPGPGSATVMIGNLPAWRALPASVGSAVESVSNAMNTFMSTPIMTPADASAQLAQIQAGLGQAAGAAAGAGNPAATATAAGANATLVATNVTLTATWTAASAVPGGQPAANQAYTEGIKAAASAASSAVFASIAGMTDNHVCTMLCPIPPHGPGMVTQGSNTVLIDNLPPARQGDQVFEACGGGNPISTGFQTVLIGDSAGGGGGGAGAASSPFSQADAASPGEVPTEQAGPLQPEETEEEPTWIGVILRDADGRPIANEQFQMTLDDGTVLSGTTDEEGHAQFEGVNPGQGEVDFVNISQQQDEDLQNEGQQNDQAASQAETVPPEEDGTIIDSDDQVFQPVERQGPYPED